MNKIIAPALFSFSFFILFSCSKNETKTEIESEIKNPPVESLISGTIIAPDSYLMLPGRDNKMHSILSAPQGTIYDAIYSDGIINETEINENINSENKLIKIYYKVIKDEVEFYVEKNKFIPETVPAVILKNSYPWKSDLMDEAIDYKLIFGKEIAAEKNDDSDLVKIYFWDKKNKETREGFIKKDYISYLKDDIEVIKIIEALKVTTRATERNKLFSRAEKYNPSLRIKSELEAQKTEVVTNSYKEVLNALPGKKYKVNVNELLTVDQSKDPFQ